MNHESALGKGFLATLCLVFCLVERSMGRWSLLDIILVVVWSLNLLTYLVGETHA